MRQLRKISCALLCAALLLALLPAAVAAVAAEPATPTLPSWCPADEYPVFEGSAAYEPENWAVIQMLRSYVEAGKIRNHEYYEQKLGEELQHLYYGYYQDAGVQFEAGLIFYGLYLNEGQ